MSKLFKLFSITLALIMFISIAPKNVYAEQDDSILGTKFEVPSLKKGEEYSHEILLSNGETGTLTIEKIEDLEEDTNKLSSIRKIPWIHWNTRKNVSNGTYKINVYMAAVNAGFKVVVKNHNITKAYDAWHFSVVGNVSGSLKRDSSKKATYTMNFSLAIPWVGGPSWTGGVQARIEGKNLVTYMY